MPVPAQALLSRGENVRNFIRLSIAAAAIALPLAAQAADVGVARRTTTFAPVFSWTGVYIGASGGQVRGGSDDWVSATPQFCNNPPLIAPFVTAASSAAVNNLLGTEITGGTGGTGVAGCYPTPVTLTGTGTLYPISLRRIAAGVDRQPGLVPNNRHQQLFEGASLWLPGGL